MAIDRRSLLWSLLPKEFDFDMNMHYLIEAAHENVGKHDRIREVNGYGDIHKHPIRNWNEAIPKEDQGTNQVSCRFSCAASPRCH